MDNKLLVFVALMLLSISVDMLALPDTGTTKTGDLCEMRHSLKYGYNFKYDKEMVIGETYDLTVSFSITGSEVTAKPYIVTAKIVPVGFEASETSLSLDSAKTIKITPIRNNPVLRIETTLILDGDDRRHPGYEATYRDSFEVSDFTVSDKQVEETTTSVSIPKNVSQTTDTTIRRNGNVSTTHEVTKTTVTLGNKTETNIDIKVNTPSPAPWYIVRLMGMLAYVFLSLSVLTALLKRIKKCGFGLLFKHHHDISVLAVLLTFLHVINNLLDKYMWSLSLDRVFWFDFSSNTKILLSLGVLSFYLMLAITFTSLSPRIIAAVKRRNWYYLHVLSYLLYIFVVIHSLFLGSDLDASKLNDPVTLVALAVFTALTAANMIASLIVAAKSAWGVKG